MGAPARGFVRRNRVNEPVAALIGVVAGLLVVAAGAEPTGRSAVDVAVVGIASAAVVWASASSPWWALTAASAVAVLVSFDPVVAGIGVVAFLLSLIIGLRQRDQSVERGIAAALVVNALVRSELDAFHGVSAIVGIVVCAFLAASGIARRSGRVRKPALTVLALGGAGLVIALAMTAVAAAAARPDVASGAKLSREGIAAVNAGNYERGAELLDRASQSFGRAHDRLTGPAAAPARLLPGLAQNVQAAEDLAAAAEAATGSASSALRQVDADRLKIRNGRVDLDALASLEAPLVAVQATIDELEAAVQGVTSPWVVEPIRDELDELQVEIDENQPRIQNAIDAVRLAPDLLGGGAPRTYLVLFASPSEARAGGGFVGNYAEVVFDDGRAVVTDFDRRSVLQDRVDANGATCAGCPDEMLTAYGPYLIAPDGSWGSGGWQNLTLPAHFPYVAETASLVYPQSGGDPVDGVLIVDPYVLAELMKYTGPVELPEFGVTVDAETATDFILVDQYLLAPDDQGGERIDAVRVLGEEVITKLLAGDLPAPADLAADLAPLVSERRLMFWTSEPAEQDLFSHTGLLGDLPELTDDGGFGVGINNASASKIEVFLERETTVEIVDRPDGSRALVADIVLRNTAPASGLPRYVIGNAVGLPPGSSRTFVTFYGPPTLETATLDGDPIEFGPFTEAGWKGYRHVLVLGPGETATYHLEFGLQPATDDLPPDPAVWVQPLVERDGP